MSNSSSPAGNLFGNSSSSTGNRPQHTTEADNQANNDPANNTQINKQGHTPDNSDATEQNNSVEDIMSQLTTGAILIDDGNANQNNQNNNAQVKEYRDADGNTITQNQSIINDLAREYKGESLLSEDTANKIAEGMQSGNLTPITDAITEASNNAFNRAVNSVLKLIPEIISASEQSVLEKVGQQNQVKDVWSQFLNEYEGYDPNNNLAKEAVINGVKAGKPKEDVFAAVDMIYGNTRTKPESDDLMDKFSPEEGSKPFDIRSVIGR